MKNLTIECYKIDFTVETVHGDKLEFVLRSAEDAYFDEHGEYQHQKTYAEGAGNYPYSEILWDMMNARLLNEIQPDGAYPCVTDMQQFGNLSYGVVIYELDKIDRTLQLCNETIDQWKEMYNIDSMQP